MKVRLPLMVQDPLTSSQKGIKTTEDFFAYSDNFYDGPVTERMAVIDLDPESGELVEGVKFVPSNKPMAHFSVPKNSRVSESGKIIKEYDIGSRQFKQAAVLAMALRTLYLFEKNKETDSDVIGRRLEWAFNAPQLFLVPRAGRGANAYYERASHSIQFFSFPSRRNPEQTIHTCLSRDIVSHETAHAILDALAPELYDATTPQSLAIHEGLADLTSAFMSFESDNVTRNVLAETRGKIDNTTAFSSIAEEFGQARDPYGKKQYLRNLYNQTKLSDLVEERPEPHALSLVLSGALYQVLVRIYTEIIRPECALEFQHKPDPIFSASGKSLHVSSEIFRRMVFGALGYLPPGDATFADYGRALIAADKAMYPTTEPSGTIRQWLKQEFMKRGIVDRENELERDEDAPDEPIQVDIDGLIASDWEAYTFAESHRTLLRIPEKITYRIWPRYFTHRQHNVKGQMVGAKECIFKVSWTELEENGYPSFPARRRVSAGTTLVLNIDNSARPRISAILTTDRGEGHSRAREAYLRLLFDQGMLRLDDRSEIQKNFPASYINAEVRNETMRVRGMARMLHIVG